MLEAQDLTDDLPLSFKTRSDQGYIVFLWEDFETNYTHGKYQFAFLVYHMLIMSFVNFNAMQANGSPSSEFDFDEDYSYFMVRLPVHPSAVELGELADAVTGQVQRLLSVCDGALSRAELQKELGLRHRDNFIAADLQPALNAGLLERTIPYKSRSSKQKYRLPRKDVP